jgi:hypothetical protein
MPSQKTYVAFDEDNQIEILVIVYEDRTVHVATRKASWETWSVPWTAEERS